MTGANPIVQVITAGADWPAIGAAIATTFAAVAGIAGTSRQARRAREDASADLQKNLDATASNLLTGIGAEDRRTELAEKRRVYEQCDAAFLAMLTAVLRQRTGCIEAKTWQERMDTRAIVDAPRQAMYNAVSGIRLIAPVPIANLATDLQAAFLEFIEESYQGAAHPSTIPPHAEMQERLVNMMRADLGVRPGTELVTTVTEDVSVQPASDQASS